MWLGPWRSNLDRPLGLDWTSEPVKVLGTFISYDNVGNERKNFAQKVDNLKQNFQLGVRVNFLCLGGA